MSVAVAPSRGHIVRRWDLPDVRDALPLVAPPAAPSAPAVRLPAACFTEADMAAARDAGRRDGLALAEQSATRAIARALQEIAVALAGAGQTTEDMAQRSADALGGVMVQAVAAAFPSFETRLGPAEVARLVRVLLPGLAREPAVRVRIAPATTDALVAELARLPEAERVRITVVADPALGAADLRVAWQDGTALRDATAIRAAVLEALEGLAADTVRADETVREGDGP